MRQVATTLSSLGFLWAAAATLYLLQGAGYDVVTTATALGEPPSRLGRVNVPMASPRGVWVAILLSTVTLLSALPLGVALSRPSAHRLTSWAVGGLLLAFAGLSAFTVGLLYLPVALVVLAGAAASPRDWSEWPHPSPASPSPAGPRPGEEW